MAKGENENSNTLLIKVLNFACSIFISYPKNHKLPYELDLY